MDAKASSPSSRQGGADESAEHSMMENGHEQQEGRQADARKRAESSGKDYNGREDEQRAGKRARRSDPDASSRGRRMFGLLNSTLAKANEDHARQSSGEAAKKRAEIEARTKERLKVEDQTMHETAVLTDELRHAVQKLFTIALELEADDAAVRVRKAQKRRLASFLITDSPLAVYDGQGRSANESVDGRTLAPEIALAIAPVGPRHPNALKSPDGHPVYFLPKKMLGGQDDILDDQEDRVDAEIDSAQDAWEATRQDKQVRMEALRENIAKLQAEMNSLEGKGEENKKEDVEMMPEPKKSETQDETPADGS